MELMIERSGEALIATVSGKFIADDAYILLKRIEDEVEGPRSHLILDIRKLEYIGSQGVSAVIKLALSHHLRLVGLTPNVKRTLEALGMVKMLRFFTTLEGAQKHVQSALEAGATSPGLPPPRPAGGASAKSAGAPRPAAPLTKTRKLARPKP